MDCGVICHTRDGSRILSINQGALDTLGFSSLDDVTKRASSGSPLGYWRRTSRCCAAAIQGLTEVGDSTSVEYRVRHSEGRILHIMAI